MSASGDYSGALAGLAGEDCSYDLLSVACADYRRDHRPEKAMFHAGNCCCFIVRSPPFAFQLGAFDLS